MGEFTKGAIHRRDWEVPDFEIAELRPGSTPYCLVIPVINEGERFVRQLRLMADQGQMNIVDIVVADGGSTDGSTEPEMLRALGVRALLVKRGPGKLSAQLRMAYAWALDGGRYEGIVTIDGNGKDGIETVPAFLAALSDGFDYVQASRFIAGGEHANTPWLRELAIRAIHAPVLSLAAGVWLTDTTQGYRAYSARYLLHPEVQPFRAVFSQYELLAYLTVRASQIGLSVKELPTRRVYPAGEPVPTKIHGFRGNLLLLTTIWRTITGRYHPRSLVSGSVCDG